MRGSGQHSDFGLDELQGMQILILLQGRGQGVRGVVGLRV